MPEAPLTSSELAALLQAVDPSVVLAPAPLLRRVIRHDRGFVAIALQVPHNKTYLVKRDVLIGLAAKNELEIGGRELPPTVTLLVRPHEDHLEETPRDSVLLEYWRLLFHARVHAALEERWEKGELTLAAIERWIAELGDTEFREACSVLGFEHMLLPPSDRRNAFIELAAVYLELFHFAGTLIPSYFPSLKDRAAALAASLDRETGALALLAATRLQGAPDPRPPAETTSEEPVAYFKKLLVDAGEESAKGNLVRAAILRTRAKRVAPAAEERPTEESALRELDALATRLVRATGSAPEKTERWKHVLSELLDKADQQDSWPPEARLLFDLQNACVHGERQVYRVNALRLLVRRDVKEELPDQRDMQLLRHLTRAEARLPSVRLSSDDRGELEQLLRGAVRDVEDRLRARLRPVLEQAITESGLTPTSLPEAVVLGKLTDELLDRTMSRWFLTYGDIRDALSANQLKLRDIEGARDLASRGTMSRIDRRLASELKGIYRPGELYRHGLQRASSLLAATKTGRALVWFLLLPVGGALGIRVAIQHVRDLVARGAGEAPPATGLVPGIELAVFAALLLVLLNNRRARAFAGSVLLHGSFALKAFFVDLPLALSHVRVARRLLENDIFMAFVRYVLRPFLLTALIAGGFWLARSPLDHAISALVFLSTALFLNSAPWRSVEEELEESLLRSWRFFRLDFFPGFLRLVMRFFKRLSEALEALVFAVDELLRYRTGEGKAVLVAKAILAPLWAPVAWALRFTFDVALEPRLNPVKYVSVVMIVDKISIPMTSRLLAFWTHAFEPLGAFGAKMLALAMLWNVPAAVGFLIWELKENWRLYRANRSPRIEAQPLALQGETLPRLLRSSGTGHGGSKLPALFARLRRAERHAHRTGSWTESRKQRAQLEEFRFQVRGFVERSFIRIIATSKGWGGVPLRVRDVVLGLNQVVIQLESASFAGQRVVIVLEAEEGWLVASMPEPGWLPDLGRRQVHVFKSALVGLYAMAGVDLVREQIQSHLADFPQLALTFSVIEEGLKVWPKDRFEAAAVYDLLGTGSIRPRPVFTPVVLALPALESSRLVFARANLSWDDWVRVWEDEEADRELRLLTEIPLPIRGLKTALLRRESIRTALPS